MTGEDLFREIGKIDNKFIQEADNRYAKHDFKRYAAIAACIIIAAATALNSSSVQAAIKRLFSFIPGIAITEETEDSKNEILYSMDGEEQTQTDGNVEFTLMNAYVTSSYIDIMWKATLNFNDESKDNETVTELAEKYGYSDYIKPNEEAMFPIPDLYSTVTIGNAIYPYTENTSAGGSPTEQTCITRIENIENDIAVYGVNMPVTITFCDMTFDIHFKPIQYYNSVDEIGPTAMHNNISVTAMPTWSENKLTIKLYSLNYSEFLQVYGYYDDLKADATLPYIIIKGNTIQAQVLSGDGTEFEFDLSGLDITDEDKKSAILHIPVISVGNHESVTLDINVNNDGTIDHPDKISFKYCDVDIISMWINKNNPDNEITMTYRIQKKSDNIGLCNFTVASLNNKSSGIGTWKQTSDNTDIEAMGFHDDAVPSKKCKHITFTFPIYTLYDEYVFALS